MVKNKRGFTLVEAVLTVALVSIVFVLGSQIFVQINRFIILNRTKIELQREARAILPIINSNLRQASVNSLIIDQVSGQPYYSRISFRRIDGTDYTFYQQNKKLIMTTSGTSQVLSSNLRYLAFAAPRSDDLTIVSVSLTLEKEITELRTKALHMASEKVMIMND